jgi:hypothetical protein
MIYKSKVEEMKKMKKLFKENFLWLFFIALSLFSTVFFLSKTIKDYKKYHILDTKAPVEISRWQIDEKKKGYYIIGAAYSYKLNDQQIEGKTRFKNKKFLNYYAALDTLTKLAKQDWYVWYSSKNIHFSDLDKSFPLKYLIYTLLSGSIFVYFLFLRKKMQDFERF